MSKQAETGMDPLQAGTASHDPASKTIKEVVPASYASVPLDCEICQHIMRGFHTAFEDTYAVDLGLTGEVLSKECATHGPMLAYLKEKFEDKTFPPRITFQEAKYHVRKLKGTTNMDITLDTNERGGGLVECLELVKESSADNVGRGVIPDPQWIDPNLPRKWRECCQQSHGDDCEHPLSQYRLAQSTPTWLIDVRNRCLTPGKPGMRYVTLSYKWGQSERPNLEKTALPQLQKPNSLTEMRTRIPETIRNAMGVVELLGEDYMWTDSLCIAQDDEANKFKELNQMAAIYANSTLTIIAAEGEDAEFGLPGLKGISKPREMKERWIDFGEKEKVIRSMFPWFHLAQTPYFKRGWTFQEYLFSKRRLIFEAQMVRWECSRCAWQEDIVHVDGPESKFRCNWMDVVVDAYPSLGAFGYMLIEYNHRQFTYEEDVLPSLTGLLSMLSQKYEGGFLCGLPDMYFEAGLNWSAWAEDLSRRTSSGLSSASKSLTILPSWSWIGWEGRISGGWRSNEDYLKKGRYTTPMYTVPITEWYTVDEPSGAKKRRISSKFLWERDLYKDHMNRPLPRGWTRHPHDPETSPNEMYRVDHAGKYYAYPPPDGCGTCFYTHDSCPDIEFWYPIPILDRDVEPIIPAQTQYLFCDTHRAYLHANTADSKPHDRLVYLRNENGTWAGILLLHSESDKELFKSDSGTGAIVELVAISRGHISSDERVHAPAEMSHEERPKEGQVYEFYNVLWVEWKDGVAYRKAHGRVLRDIWEKQHLEPLSLVLG